MVRIRLARAGRKKDIFYRIVAIEKTRKNQGAALEILGYWYPKKNEKKIDQKAYLAWIEKGALPSQKVKELVGKK